MAQRRMFSLKIIDSARFLKMPPSTRLLYYDLCMRADDDGVVEGFNVLRMTGSTEDDLKVLVAKDFIKILNEDLVSYILDWKEHNKIRADRKVNSIYKDLLVQVMPDVKLLEPRKRADSKAKEEACTDEQNNWTSNGQTTDGIGEDRIGKDRIGKDSLGEDKIDNSLSSVVHSNIEVFKHFEKCGFMVSSMLMEKIAADIEIYGTKNLMDAATEAMERGKLNNYKYVIGIVQNWQTEGRKEKSKDNKFQPNPKTAGFNNFEPREYDYDSLEKKLLGWDKDDEEE